MFSLFNRKKNEPEKEVAALLSVETDWHCHVLGGIDDGAQSDEETLAMLKQYEKLGIKKVVATPHIHSDYFRNTPNSIKTAFDTAKKLIETYQIALELNYAAEYFANDFFLNLIENKEILTIDNQYVLFELSMQQQPLFGNKLVDGIQKLGYIPLLAHPERYRYWHNKPKEWARWREMGVYFQLNLLSLSGQYGSAERKAAEQMIELDLIDAVGTDAHSAQHLRKLTNLNTNPYFKTLEELPLLNKMGN